MKFDLAAMTEDDFFDLHATERWTLVAKLREVLLESDGTNINECMKAVEDQIDEVEIWWLCLSPKRKIEEAPFVKEFLDLAEEFMARNLRRVRAYALKAHGVDIAPEWAEEEERAVQ